VYILNFINFSFFSFLFFTKELNKYKSLRCNERILFIKKIRGELSLGEFG
jgi:hypothetical protein